MRVYSRSHALTCGVDLQGRTLYVCFLDGAGLVVLHCNLPCQREVVLAALAPFRDDPVVGCDCIFSWYGLADLCGDEGLDFALGHALGIPRAGQRAELKSRRRFLHPFPHRPALPLTRA